jgi:hypothetical protein
LERTQGTDGHIVAIEPTTGRAEEVRGRLTRSDGVATVLCTPVRRMDWMDPGAKGYDLEQIRDELNRWAPFDFCVIDPSYGQSQEAGPHDPAAAMVAGSEFLAHDALILLDDALADGQLRTLEQWHDGSRVRSLGVCTCGYGLYVGRSRKESA